MKKTARTLSEFQEMAAAVVYDPMTGEMRARDGSGAYTSYRNGYVVIVSRGFRISAHRLAWFIFHGALPKQMIDHVNMIKDDNSITNLRECDMTRNQYNRSAQRNNKCGVKGVYWRPSRNCWQAVIRANGKRLYYKCFKNLNEARAAINEARNRLHGDFARS